MKISAALKMLKEGKITEREAEKAVSENFYADIGCAKVDLDRLRRTGAEEVIFGEGKTPEQIIEIAKVLVEKFGAAMATRVPKGAFETIKGAFPDALYSDAARIVTIDRRAPKARKPGRRAKKTFIAVVCAGTADLPVAQEAAETARFLGSSVRLFADCGVAGLHRLLDNLDQIRKAKVVVAVAGMEGALPSVLGGLLKAPVIAVPTSVGYGASFGGITALLSMLNSCANGVSVVNIDNGFGAGYNAHIINSI